MSSQLRSMRCFPPDDLREDPTCQPFTFEGSKKHGILIIHGFTATPGTVYPMGKSLFEHTGCTVHGILLPGHGLTAATMVTTHWQDWLNAALAAFDALARECEKVSVVGLSMGGTLTLLLCEQRPVYRAVPMAAALRVINRWAKLCFFVRPFLKCLPWEENPAHPDRGDFLNEYNRTYTCTPLQSVVDMNRLRARAKRGLSKITCPLLVVRSGKDETVHFSSADKIMAGASSKNKTMLELKKSPHVCTLGPEREALFAAAARFLTE